MTTTLRTVALALGFTTLGAVSVIGTQAIAQAGRGMGQGPGQGLHARGAGAQGPMGKLASLIQELDLSEEQQAQAQGLRADVRETMQEHRGEREDDLNAVVEALQAEPANAKAIHALIDERQDRRAEMAHSMADAALDLWGILDAEQQAIVLDRIDDFEQRRGRMQRAMMAD